MRIGLGCTETIRQEEVAPLRRRRRDAIASRPGSRRRCRRRRQREITAHPPEGRQARLQRKCIRRRLPALERSCLSITRGGAPERKQHGFLSRILCATSMSRKPGSRRLIGRRYTRPTAGRCTRNAGPAFPLMSGGLPCGRREWGAHQSTSGWMRSCRLPGRFTDFRSPL